MAQLSSWKHVWTGAASQKDTLFSNIEAYSQESLSKQLPNKLTVKQKLTLNCLQAKMNGVNHQVIIFKTEEEKWRKFMLYLNKQQSAAILEASIVATVLILPNSKLPFVHAPDVPDFASQNGCGLILWHVNNKPPIVFINRNEDVPCKTVDPTKPPNSKATTPTTSACVVSTASPTKAVSPHRQQTKNPYVMLTPIKLVPITSSSSTSSANQPSIAANNAIATTATVTSQSTPVASSTSTTSLFLFRPSMPLPASTTATPNGIPASTPKSSRSTMPTSARSSLVDPVTSSSHCPKSIVSSPAERDTSAERDSTCSAAAPVETRIKAEKADGDLRPGSPVESHDSSLSATSPIADVNPVQNETFIISTTNLSPASPDVKGENSDNCEPNEVIAMAANSSFSGGMTLTPVAFDAVSSAIVSNVQQKPDSDAENDAIAPVNIAVTCQRGSVNSLSSSITDTPNTSPSADVCATVDRPVCSSTAESTSSSAATSITASSNVDVIAHSAVSETFSADKSASVMSPLVIAPTVEDVADSSPCNAMAITAISVEANEPTNESETPPPPKSYSAQVEDCLDQLWADIESFTTGSTRNTALVHICCLRSRALVIPALEKVSYFTIKEPLVRETAVLSGVLAIYSRILELFNGKPCTLEEQKELCSMGTTLKQALKHYEQYNNVSRTARVKIVATEAFTRCSLLISAISKNIISQSKIPELLDCVLFGADNANEEMKSIFLTRSVSELLEHNNGEEQFAANIATSNTSPDNCAMNISPHDQDEQTSDCVDFQRIITIEPEENYDVTDMQMSLDENESETTERESESTRTEETEQTLSDRLWSRIKLIKGGDTSAELYSNINSADSAVLDDNDVKLAYTLLRYLEMQKCFEKKIVTQAVRLKDGKILEDTLNTTKKYLGHTDKIEADIASVCSLLEPWLLQRRDLVLWAKENLTAFRTQLLADKAELEAAIEQDNASSQASAEVMSQSELWEQLEADKEEGEITDDDEDVAKEERPTNSLVLGNIKRVVELMKEMDALRSEREQLKRDAAKLEGNSGKRLVTCSEGTPKKSRSGDVLAPPAANSNDVDSDECVITSVALSTSIPKTKKVKKVRKKRKTEKVDSESHHCSSIKDEPMEIDKDAQNERRPFSATSNRQSSCGGVSIEIASEAARQLGEQLTASHELRPEPMATHSSEQQQLPANSVARKSPPNERSNVRPPKTASLPNQPTPTGKMGEDQIVAVSTRPQTSPQTKTAAHTCTSQTSETIQPRRSHADKCCPPRQNSDRDPRTAQQKTPPGGENKETRENKACWNRRSTDADNIPSSTYRPNMLENFFLYVYGVPSSLTKDDLAKAFSNVGRLVVDVDISERGKAIIMLRGNVERIKHNLEKERVSWKGLKFFTEPVLKNPTCFIFGPLSRRFKCDAQAFLRYGKVTSITCLRRYAVVVFETAAEAAKAKQLAYAEMRNCLSFSAFVVNFHSYVQMDEYKLQNYFEQFGEIVFFKWNPRTLCGSVEYLHSMQAQQVLKFMRHIVCENTIFVSSPSLDKPVISKEKEYCETSPRKTIESAQRPQQSPRSELNCLRKETDVVQRHRYRKESENSVNSEKIHVSHGERKEKNERSRQTNKEKNREEHVRIDRGPQSSKQGQSTHSLEKHSTKQSQYAACKSKSMANQVKNLVDAVSVYIDATKKQIEETADNVKPGRKRGSMDKVSPTQRISKDAAKNLDKKARNHPEKGESKREVVPGTRPLHLASPPRYNNKMEDDTASLHSSIGDTRDSKDEWQVLDETGHCFFDLSTDTSDVIEDGSSKRKKQSIGNFDSKKRRLSIDQLESSQYLTSQNTLYEPSKLQGRSILIRNLEAVDSRHLRDFCRGVGGVDEMLVGMNMLEHGKRMAILTCWNVVACDKLLNALKTKFQAPVQIYDCDKDKVSFSTSSLMKEQSFMTK